MNSKYFELFSLSIEQPFYLNKICEEYKVEPIMDFLITPTEECRNLMKRMGLIFRNSERNGGFIVLTKISRRAGEGDYHLRFPARKGEKLSFLMIIRNLDVLNFNDLAIQTESNQIYYFSNQVDDPRAIRSNLHLNKNATGVKAEVDSIKKTNEIYHFQHSGIIPSGAAKVKHLLTGREVEPKSLLNEEGRTDLTFDLSSFPLGQCQLLINNVEADKFYNLGKISSQPFFGVIELSLSNTLAANYRILETDQLFIPQRPYYLIGFRNRQTFWRYTIHLETNSPIFLEMEALNNSEKNEFISRLNIVSNNTNITFKLDSTSDKNFVFVSENKQPLQEKYYSSSIGVNDILNLMLKKYIGNPSKEAIIKKYLPYPQTSSLDARNFPLIYSDVFITL
jgi:hypothetical protein